MSSFIPETIRRVRDEYYTPDSPMDSPAGSLTSSPTGSLASSPTGSPTGSQYHQNLDGNRKRRQVMLVNPSTGKNGGKKYTRKLKMGSRKYKTNKTNKSRGGKKRSSRKRA